MDQGWPGIPLRAIKGTPRKIGSFDAVTFTSKREVKRRFVDTPASASSFHVVMRIYILKTRVGKLQLFTLGNLSPLQLRKLCSFLQESLLRI